MNTTKPKESKLDIPGTVEYRGFTITFQKIFGDGDPKLRCQIREDESFVKEESLAEDGNTELFNVLLTMAKFKIDVMYHIIETTAAKFHKMWEKQVKRNMIDERITDVSGSFINQFHIMDKFLTNQNEYYGKDGKIE